MRAPGNTPGALGLESAIDELAEKLGVDPLALRDRIDRSPVRREERRIGAERIGWSRRHAPGADPGPVKRGLGMAQSLWGANVQTAASMRGAADGATASVEAFSSVQDIGSGIGTVIQQTIAETLGLQPRRSSSISATRIFPPGPPSYGSRTTASITPPARVAAWKILQAMFAEAAPALNAGPDDLLARGGLHRDALRTEALDGFRRGRGADRRRHVERHRDAQRGLRRLQAHDGRGGARAAGSRRRAVRRSRGRRRNRDHPGRAGGRGAGLRPADSIRCCSKARSRAAC